MSNATSPHYGPTEEQKTRFLERRERAQACRPVLLGRCGILPNGTRWRLDKPQNPGYERTQDKVQVHFDDPRTMGFMASALEIEAMIEKFGMEYFYSEALKEHVRVLALRQLKPAEPGDPDGFLVKWERKEGAA